MVQEGVDDSLGGIAKFLNENDVISLHNLQETVSKVKLHNEKGRGSTCRYTIFTQPGLTIGPGISYFSVVVKNIRLIPRLPNTGIRFQSRGAWE